MTPPMHLPAEIIGPTQLTIYHQGPSHHGPLPALFYFALSGSDSLALDPYNQPVAFLRDAPIHVFSFTLPGHGPGLDNRKAIAYWAEEIGKGRNLMQTFVNMAIQNIDYLVELGMVDPHRIGAAGLSRGGFAAAHLAAKDPRIKSILGFAPLTDLHILEEFQELVHHPLVEALSLKSIVGELADKHLRFYIGNRDERVGTSNCFEFIRALADKAYGRRHRSPPIEMMINPSIGHKGHGTSPEIFKDGISWLKKQLILQH